MSPSRKSELGSNSPSARMEPVRNGRLPVAWPARQLSGCERLEPSGLFSKRRVTPAWDPMNSTSKTDGTEGRAATARGEVLEGTDGKAAKSRGGPDVSHGTVRGDLSGHHPGPSTSLSQMECVGCGLVNQTVTSVLPGP